MALVGSLKTAGEITQAMIGLRDSAQIQSKVIELNGLILAAQNSAFAANVDLTRLLQRVNDLEKQVAEFDTWNAEKQRYELVNYGDETYAYRLKGEASHRACAKCFHKKEISILQNVGGIYHGQEQFWCPSCNQKFFFGPYKRSEPTQTRAIGSDRSWMGN